MTKTCSKCKEEKPATTEYFRKVSSKKDLLRAVCNACNLIEVREWRNKNIEKSRESSNKWKRNNKEEVKKYNELYKDKKHELYEINKDRYKEMYKKRYENNKEKYDEMHKKAVKKYYESHKEKRLEYSKAYEEINKEKRRIQHLEWRRSNPDKSTIQVQRRRALKKNCKSTLTHDEWELIKMKFENKCAYCGKLTNLHQEHFIPLSKGGEHAKTNIIPSCVSCNSSKNCKSFFEWYPKQKFYLKSKEKKILEYLNCVK